MFIHNLKYAFKTLFRNKMLIFWTFAFPIILGTLFNLAFSNITESEKLDIIDIAIVETEEFQNNFVFKIAFQELSKKGKDQIFDIQYVKEEKAKSLLEDEKITGYLKLEAGEPKITVINNGINQTIFKYITEEIWQMSKTGELNLEQVNIKDISNKNLDYTMIEFYTLIAMAALYGGILSIFAINQSIANLSSKGKRISVSPTKKFTVILSSLLASYLAQVIGLVLLFVYTIFVLKVDYGSNLGLVILLALVGSLAGLALGLAVGVLSKSNENGKIGILIAITMLCCYLSGMMGITMKYIVDKNAPIINKINPAAMITDGFYSLYYYDTFHRYWFNVTSLLIFAGILVIISLFKLRRQKYDSI